MLEKIGVVSTLPEILAATGAAAGSDTAKTSVSTLLEILAKSSY